MTKEEKEELRKLRQEAFAKLSPSEKINLLNIATDNFLERLHQIGVCHDQYVYLLLAMLENATVGDPSEFNVTLISLKEDKTPCPN